MLIEKDWLAFGHKFTDRCGHIGGDNKEMAPVFTQFLDVIWQIMQQHPCAFEFNERFLIRINDSVHNVQYGTFVGNCEKDRKDLRLVDEVLAFACSLTRLLLFCVRPDYRNDATRCGRTWTSIGRNIEIHCTRSTTMSCPSRWHRRRFNSGVASTIASRLVCTRVISSRMCSTPS